MLNVIRRFLRPSLREQLEDGVREALRRYGERRVAPNLRVFVSADLIPEGIDGGLWARDEEGHLRRFALQWAEDNHLPRAGLRVEIVLLDTKREFAFVKPIGLDAAEEAEPRPAPRGAPSPPRAMVAAEVVGAAVLEVVESSSLKEPLRVKGELTVGRKGEDGVVGLGDRYMSARHARFHLAGGALYVTDLDSKNRTFVNDRPIPPHEQVALSRGDRVRMGGTTVRLSGMEP